MATAAEIYGRIGAAKAFSSSVSNSLKDKNDLRESIIDNIDDQINNSSDEREKKNLERKKKRLKRLNQMNSSAQKVAKSSTDFLTKISSYLDISMEMIAKYIANVVVATLPSLEVSVKMLLLSNIKKMVSCSIDPRIPDEWRTEGIILNEAMVDPRQVLETSPISKWGKYLYFGIYDEDETNKLINYDFTTDRIVGERNPDKIDHKGFYEFARAQDMNAFLWFAKNKERFVSSNIIDNANDFFDVNSDSTLYNTHKFKGIDSHKYVGGSSFKIDNNAQTIFLCEKVEYDSNGNRIYTILPASDTWTGITWYKDRTNINGSRKNNNVNYDKSKPLFNIEYLSGNDYNMNTLGTLYPNGNFRFRILPKPFSTAGGFIASLKNNVDTMYDMVGQTGVTEVVADEIVDNNYNFKFQGIQSPIPYKARFNKNGEYDKKGIYSINLFKYDIVDYSSENNIFYYGLAEGNINNTPSYYLSFDKKSKTFDLLTSGKNRLENISDRMSLLRECYCGSTIYEFNYDYVVSMKLFDEKSIAIGIVNSLMNISIPKYFTWNNNGEENNEDGRRNIQQIRIDSYINKLVEKIINNEEGEFTDCFYYFSNEDYESMEMDVANKISNGTFLTDDSNNLVQQVYDIIDAYDTNGTLNERIENISLAILKAGEACGFDNNTNPLNENTNIQYPLASDNGTNPDFIEKMVKFLTSSIVDSILTPKVLLLMQINRMMMGTDILPDSPSNFKGKYTFSVEDVLNGLSALLDGIIKEIINVIQKELLRVILERLSELCTSYLKRLGIEYAMKWVTLIRQIFSCINISSFGTNANSSNYLNKYANTINSIIDDVDYADINQSIDKIIPQTNPC